MIIGLISDAHGNSLGLEKCLRRLKERDASRLYFLGDGVGYLAEENRVYGLLHDHDVLCVRGNHEEMLLGNRVLDEERDKTYRLAEARSRLFLRWRTWIETWPLQRIEVIDGKRLLFVHGSPEDPIEGRVYSDSDLAPLRRLPYDAIFLGQTHRSFVSVDRVTIASVGSCGLPRDVKRSASCAIYDTVRGTCEIIRVPLMETT